MDAQALDRSDEALVRIVAPLWGSEEESFNLAESVAEKFIPALENALPSWSGPLIFPV